MEARYSEHPGVNPEFGHFATDFHKFSHELRTPLTCINGFAELALMDEDLSPACAEFIRAILSGSEALSAVVLAHLDEIEQTTLATPTPPQAPAVGDDEGAYLGFATGSWTLARTAQRPRPVSVIGPVGQPLTLASLPPPGTKRWIAQRKAELVAAVDGGLLTIEEVCGQYDITLEEFVSWQRCLERLGMRGLWLTRLQKSRNLLRRRPPPPLCAAP